VPRARQLRQPGRPPILRTRNHPRTALGPATRLRVDAPSCAHLQRRSRRHARRQMTGSTNTQNSRSLRTEGGRFPPGRIQQRQPALHPLVRRRLHRTDQAPGLRGGKGVAAAGRSLPAGIGALTVSSSAQPRSGPQPGHRPAFEIWGARRRAAPITACRCRHQPWLGRTPCRHHQSAPWAEPATPCWRSTPGDSTTPATRPSPGSRFAHRAAHSRDH